MDGTGGRYIKRNRLDSDLRIVGYERLGIVGEGIETGRQQLSSHSHIDLAVVAHSTRGRGD